MTRLTLKERRQALQDHIQAHPRFSWLPHPFYEAKLKRLAHAVIAEMTAEELAADLDEMDHGAGVHAA